MDSGQIPAVEPPAGPAAVCRMPAEWETHAASWLAWPHAPLTWPNRLSEARQEFARLVRTLAETETVYVLTGSSDQASVSAIRQQLDADSLPIVPVPIATNDSWVRDYGPTFVVPSAPGPQNRTRGVLWQFNAWGGKYQPYDSDAAAGKHICDYLGIEALPIPLVFEGGAIETNGNGCLVTTRSCALQPARNPQLDEAKIADHIRHALGARHVLMAEGAQVVGDDTDGHVDQLVRFVTAETLVVAVSGAGDSQAASLEANQRSLDAEIAGAGLSLTTLPLPIPSEPVKVDGKVLPASYCNFYFCNQRLLVPQFGVPEDEHALGLLRDLCPDREVIGLPSRYLLVGLGSFHCLTQQQPAPTMSDVQQ